MERYSFYFTIPNRKENVLYSFHSNVSMEFFISFIKNEMLYFSTNDTIEIFETHQNENIELFTKTNHFEKNTLKEVFGDKWKEISFSIKFTKKDTTNLK